jgi:hypothetical protein
MMYQPACKISNGHEELREDPDTSAFPAVVDVEMKR